jgi:hypothetical protein
MRPAILTALVTAALVLPAHAASYPVSGKWGQSAGGTKGAIDCGGKRVIAFNGNQRTDSGGGVAAYRNKSVTASGASQYRIVDEFTNGMVSNAYANYTLRVLDDDHIELQMQKGGALALQRCK